MRHSKERRGKEVNKKDMEELYTIKEVSTAKKLSRATLYRYIKSGLLPALKVGGKGKGGALRFRNCDLEKFEKRLQYRPATA